VLPVGRTRSLLIGPATLFGDRLRRTAFSLEKTFPEKKICMGKQKNRLTPARAKCGPARIPAVCPAPAHHPAVAACPRRPRWRRSARRESVLGYLATHFAVLAAHAQATFAPCKIPSRVPGAALGHWKASAPGYLSCSSRVPGAV
jgi:hypothetical protein